MFKLVYLAVVLGSAVLCHFIAKKQGTNPLFWGMMGALFGPFAIPFVLMIRGGPPRAEDEEED